MYLPLVLYMHTETFDLSYVTFGPLITANTRSNYCSYINQFTSINFFKVASKTGAARSNGKRIIVAKI